MKRLFIIGNGFDLHFGLSTRVDDFTEFLSEKKIMAANVWGIADEIYDQYEVNWGDFEESLSELNIESIYEDNSEGPNYLSDRESDRDGVISQIEDLTYQLLDARDEALNDMIDQANTQLEKVKSQYKKNIFDNSTIVTFNYTSTLEHLFNLQNSPILHIHGKFSDGEELIFGYKNPRSFSLPLSDDYYFNEQKGLVEDFYEANKKDFQYDILEKFLKDKSNIEEVVVLGHSMAEVDKEYMEIIEKHVSPAKWTISQFNANPGEKDISQYSFANKVVFDTIDNILRNL